MRLFFIIFLLSMVSGCGNYGLFRNIFGSSVPWLEVNGGQLETHLGGQKILHGVSSHGLQWFPQFTNYDSLKWLRDDWKISVVRAAMYTDPRAGGYISNRKLKDVVYKIVDDAMALDLYVIIDWHILSDGDPNRYRGDSIYFFEEAAKKYGNSPNVIFEICNEPNGNVSWDREIRPYAVALIEAIRRHAPKNIIIVGTSTWSQDVDKASDHPLEDSNIMYALHFYAGTHNGRLRDKIDTALSRGLGIFVSEWGVSQATGSGGVYERQSDEWLEYLESKGISWVNWNLSDGRETSALLMPGSDPRGGWSDGDLSRGGRYVKGSILKYARDYAW